MLSMSSLSPLLAATRCSLHPNSLLVWHWLSYIRPAVSHPPPLAAIPFLTLRLCPSVFNVSVCTLCLRLVSQRVAFLTGQLTPVSSHGCLRVLLPPAERSSCSCLLKILLFFFFFWCYPNCFSTKTNLSCFFFFLPTADAVAAVSIVWDHEELTKGETSATLNHNVKDSVKQENWALPSWVMPSCVIVTDNDPLITAWFLVHFSISPHHRVHVSEPVISCCLTALVSAFGPLIKGPKSFCCTL